MLVARGGDAVEVLDVDAGVSTVLRRTGRRMSFTTVSVLGSGDLLLVGGYDDQIRLHDDLMIIPERALG
jgi:hypothetical protein